MRGRVLVVSGREVLRALLGSELAQAGFRVTGARDGVEGFERFQREAPDLVVSDLDMPRCDGIGLVGRIRKCSSVPVMVYTPSGGVRDAVAAMKSGADDFVDSSDVGVEEFVARAAARVRVAAAAVGPSELLVELPGGSPAILRARARVEALAPLSEPVLVTGEPGTGRKSAARALHRLGRPECPFLCLDSEALGSWPSLPQRGSVYVGGIDRLSKALQESWLRELEAQRHDVRWLASGSPAVASSRGPLLSELAERLRRFHVPLPTLRERPEDVPRIARQLVESLGARLRRPRRFTDCALQRLRAHPWSRNVAELQIVVEKLVAFSSDREIDGTAVAGVLAEVGFSVEGLRRERERQERDQLIAALEETGGNMTRTAARLGRSRAAVYRMVERHGVPLRLQYGV